MQLKWILAGCVSVLVSSSAIADPVTGVAYDFENTDPALVTAAGKLKDLEKQRAELQKQIDACDSNVNNMPKRSCKVKGRWSTMWEREYEDLVTKHAELNVQVDRAKTAAEKEAKDAAAKNKKDAQNSFLKKYLDAKNLLVDSKIFGSELKATGLQLKTLYLQMNQTLLGDYAKYVAAEYAKSDEMKANICNTVNTCSSTKKMKDTIDKQGKAIKSFEAFKVEMQKAASTSVDPSASGGAP